VNAIYSGSCFCGAIRIEASGAPVEMGFCHCRSCRAHSGAPVTAFTLWKEGQVKVTRGVGLFARFSKTGFSDRHFCTRCGGIVMVGHPELGMTDVHAGILPDLDFRPSVHLNYAETVLPMRDGLPKLKDLPVEAGGSGDVVAE